MKPITAVSAKRLRKFLAKDIRQIFDSAQQDRAERLGSLAQSIIDLTDKYPAFFWDSVSKHISPAMTYLNATVSGQQWIANLHNHVFCAEHSYGLWDLKPEELAFTLFGSMNR
jgi:hypothetical protein